MANPDLIVWDNGAENFEREKHNNLGFTVEKQIELPIVLAMLGDARGKSVVELGCGTGEVTGDNFEGAKRVTGIDGSSNQLRVASERYPGKEFLLSDLIEPLPFSNCTFDLAYSRFVLMFLSELNGFASETTRILNPEGKFVFTVPYPFYPYIQELTKTPHRYSDLGEYGKESKGTMTIDNQQYPYYFRPTEGYIMPFVNAGMRLFGYHETIVPKEIISEQPNLKRMEGRPVFLTVGFQKPN